MGIFFSKIRKKYNHHTYSKNSKKCKKEKCYCIDRSSLEIDCPVEIMSDDFIDAYADNLNWDHISCTVIFSEYISKKYHNRINWKNVKRCHEMHLK